MPALSPATESIEAPPAERFPTYPVAWYLFGDSAELADRPVSKDLLGRRLVAFRTASGTVAILDARCSHLHADLGNGSVVGEAIQCPYHHWRYSSDGHCVHIPANVAIPAFARQRSYPAVERHGLVFFFNGPNALYPLPFFADADPKDFIRARPFGMTLQCPWWLVGANACDLQHFLGSHDRRLAGEPTVETPNPFSRRASAPFAVVGSSWRDRLTSWFGGDRVELAITDWCGTMMFVTATFRRTRSYGLLTSIPLGREGVYVRGIVFVRRSRNVVGRWLIDPIHLRLRRFFIKEFLRPDAELAARGLLYQPRRLLACDVELASYFQWLVAATDAASQESAIRGQESGAK
jgi:nitrite reductase/ring-hydroxylating ferredoxin subunit